jgi:hypothetical protein
MIKCDFAGAYNIFVEDFMLRNIKYIWNGMSYKELKQTIIEGRKVRAFPLVDNPSKSTPPFALSLPLPCCTTRQAPPVGLEVF